MVYTIMNLSVYIYIRMYNHYMQNYMYDIIMYDISMYDCIAI